MKPLCPVLLTLLAALAVPAPAASPALAASPSPFLREQAGSPVAWLAWDPATVNRAAADGRPVYVFFGSFLNELSRATCRQTFANPDVAAFLNATFLCVLVDRDEQPEIAAAVQHYLRIVKQTDGWPAHLWLTPDFQPYDGAGYLPPSEEWGKPGFLKVAHQAADAWTASPKNCRARAADAIATMNAPPEALPSGPDGKLEAKLTEAADTWRGTLDATNGGFGSAPRTAEPELLSFLLRRTPADRDAALVTLRAATNGALRDPLDGGFFARATDAAWHLPYLQKTLADQARIALAALDAARVAHDAAAARTARGALDYALARLALPGGGFALAEDATADETAGYYGWTAAEIEAVLGPAAAAFEQAYAVQAAGNIPADDDPAGHFKGRNFLRRATPPGDAAAEASLEASAARLRAARDRRPAPQRDDRATAGAHGLMLAALARAGGQLGEARYLKAAEELFQWVQKELVASPEGELRRLRGVSGAAAPGDYTALAVGCRELARTGKHPEADALAAKLLARAAAVYFDAAHGRYYAAPAALPPGLFVRAPALGDPLAPEALALLAGAPPEQADPLTRGLTATLEAGTPAPGEVLLALSR